MKIKNFPFFFALIYCFVYVKQGDFVCAPRKVRASDPGCCFHKASLLQLQENLSYDNGIHACTCRNKFRSNARVFFKIFDAQKRMHCRCKTNADFHKLIIPFFPKFRQCRRLCILPCLRFHGARLLLRNLRRHRLR